MTALRHIAFRRLAASLAAVAVLTAACGGGDDDSATGPDGDDAPSTTLAPTPAPLTGVLLQDGSIASRPAVAVKVDNGPQGRPQSGIDKADVLIEEKVEGGITRFIAVFHSQDAELVGPVRSVRSTDAGLVAAIGGVFAFAGGIPPFEELARQQPVTVVSERASSEGFTYPPGKRRPYKTYTSTPTLRSLADEGAKAPPRLSEFLGAGEAFAPAAAGPATSASVGFGARSSFTVDFDPASGLWKRSVNGAPHVTAGGEQLGFANVIIQITSYRPTSFRDPSGSVVDEAAIVGSGDAVVLSQGKQAPVKWSKTSNTAVTSYTDAAGNPVKLAPGRTLIALPPPGGIAIR
ncbi:MAG: DUF3048 domain-containing protein [Actinomycetota bacterium]|nr:DUF3048 domain-containing protein [Actinomycetota bacterium]